MTGAARVRWNLAVALWRGRGGGTLGGRNNEKWHGWEMGE